MPDPDPLGYYKGLKWEATIRRWQSIGSQIATIVLSKTRHVSKHNIMTKITIHSAKGQGVSQSKQVTQSLALGIQAT